MADEKPNPFSQMMRGRTAGRITAFEQDQYERGLVTWVLTRLKLKHHSSRISDLAEAGGARKLSFAAFNEYFTEFPFFLGCHNLKSLALPYGKKTTGFDYTVHADPDSFEPARFRKFSRVPFVIAYKHLFESLDSSRRIAMIFPRRGLQRGMVIHNDESEKYWQHGLSWVYKFPETGNRLYVMPAAPFIDSIYAAGRGWRPSFI